MHGLIFRNVSGKVSDVMCVVPELLVLTNLPNPYFFTRLIAYSIALSWY